MSSLSFAKNLVDEKETLIADVAAIITTATKDLFSVMFDSEVKIDKFFIDDKLKGVYDISGIVNMYQETLEGTFVVSFKRDLILKLLSNYYEKEFSEFDEVVQQGVGEITNIIFGHLKGELSKVGYRMRMIMPSVVMGYNHQFNLCDQEVSSMNIPVNIGEDRFNITILLRNLTNE